MEGKVFFADDGVYICVVSSGGCPDFIYFAKDGESIELIGDSDAGLPIDAPTVVKTWLWG